MKNKIKLLSSHPLIKLENQLIKLSVIKKLACLIKESLNILKQLIENKIFYIILCMSVNKNF